MKVQDIMTTDVKSCVPEDTLAAAALLMWDNDCGAVPVVTETGQVVGMITDRDICMALATRNARPADVQVGAVIELGQVQTCAPANEVRAALDIMGAAQLRRLPVTDETNQLVGILSMADVLRFGQKSAGKKSKSVSRKQVLRTLKQIDRPHVHAGEPDTLDAEPDETTAAGVNPEPQA